MSFTQSVSYCLSNYFTVSGRGLRSEYWFFILACFLASAAGSIIDAADGFPVLGPLISLGTFIPSITAATRRLHDTDRSGWWQLLVFIPLIGWIILLVWTVSRGTEGPNRYGAAPAGSLYSAGVRA